MIDPHGSVESKEFENNREYPVRDANYSMNVRLFGLIGKMSPRGNIEGDSESNSEKNEINNIYNNFQKKRFENTIRKKKEYSNKK